MPTTFQYVSDIHTEMYADLPRDIFSTFRIEVLASNLILGGDIGYPFHKNYFDFLTRITPYYTNIFLIAGNHEYYQSKFEKLQNFDPQTWMETVNKRIHEICTQFPNVHFLDNDTFDMPDTNLTILGGTFWSDIKEEEEKYVVNCISDYRCIPSFSPSKSRALHQTACQALQSALDNRPDRKFVVISHHLPSYELVAEQYRQIKPPMNSAFASDIPLADNPRIVGWVAGHTHTPMELGKFHVNPFGYPREAKQGGTFHKTFTLE